MIRDDGGWEPDDGDGAVPPAFRRRDSGPERDDDDDDGDGRRGWTPSGRDDGWRAPPEPRPKAEPSLFRHVLDCAAIALLATLLLTYLLPRAWAGYASVLLVIATAAVWATTYQVTRSRPLAGYLLAWGLLISGWFTAARFLGPWHAPVIVAFLAGVAILTPAGVSVIARHKAAVAADEQAAGNRQNTVLLERWADELAVVGARGMQILEVIRHDESRSLEIRGRLPRGTGRRGTMTFEQLAEKAGELAVHLRRDDDGVYFSKVKHGSAADWVMHVRDKSSGRKQAPVHLPVISRPLTITRPIAFGLLDSGREYSRLLREIHVQIIGVSGMGKSNLINVFLDRLAGCPDVLIWMLDMKGGRTSRPWIEPWLQGLTPRPVIDWIATERAEAKLMLDTALLGIKTRSGYKGFEKIHPTADVPQVVIICDDVSVCFGHNTRDEGINNFGLSQLGSKITELGRSEAFMLVGAGQRANVELWGGTGMKSQSQFRFGLRCTEPGDGAQIFPDSAQAARQVSRLRNEGDCLIKDGPDISPVVHLYRVDDDERIIRRALWAGDYRPLAEQRLKDAMGDVYANRWERAASLLDEWRADAGPALSLVQEPGDDDGDDEDFPRLGDDAGQDDYNQMFEKIVSSDKVLASMPDPEGDVNADPRRKEMWRILRDAGPAGLAVKAIGYRLESKGAGARRETIHHWLKADEQKGWVRRGRRGTQNVWIWTGHGDADYLLDAM